MWWAFVVILFNLNGGIATPAQIVRFPVQSVCEQARESMGRAVEGLPVLVSSFCTQVTAPEK